MERYAELLRHHVVPHLGAAQLQRLRTLNITDLYARLLTAKPEGAGLAPRTVGHVHRLLRQALGQALFSLHALRHTHASQLLAAGVDVVTVSRRLGHSNPTVTLNVYAHLFGNPDERASETVERALGGILGS